MPEFLFTPTPNEPAQRFLQGKPAVSRAVFDGLLPELRARAFVITGVENANVVQKIRNQIAQVGNFMKKYPTTTAVIEGHTDNVGQAKANLGLSQQRAEAVRTYQIGRASCRERVSSPV